MKRCKIEGCDRFQFGGSYCPYHQYIRRMKGGDLFKPNTEAKKQIPKESKTRKREHKTYNQNCKELERETRNANDGKIYCYFSDKEITGFVTWHHLLGRTGDFYVDKEWLVPVINEYHIDYHFKPIGWLILRDWYVNLLEKFKLRDAHLYYKEFKRQDKAELYFENNDE